MNYKQRLVIFLTLFLLLSATGLYWASAQRQKEEQKIEKEVEGVKDFSSTPQITNIAPIEAFVDREYRYDVSVVDADTFSGDLIIELVDAPSWIFKSGLSIYGTPAESDIGTQRVIFTLTDGTDTITEEFYIVVSASNEGSN